MNKIFGIIVLATLIFFMASCGNSAPSGEYRNSETPSWTITFGPEVFTMIVPASVSPSKKEIIANGRFTVSGKYLLLTDLAQPMLFTITDSKTLTESEGGIWIKQ